MMVDSIQYISGNVLLRLLPKKKYFPSGDSLCWNNFVPFSLDMLFSEFPNAGFDISVEYPEKIFIESFCNLTAPCRKIF